MGYEAITEKVARRGARYLNSIMYCSSNVATEPMYIASSKSTHSKLLLSIELFQGELDNVREEKV
jgi:hypothetical protein